AEPPAWTVAGPLFAPDSAWTAATVAVVSTPTQAATTVQCARRPRRIGMAAEYMKARCERSLRRRVGPVHEVRADPAAEHSGRGDDQYRGVRLRSGQLQGGWNQERKAGQQEPGLGGEGAGAEQGEHHRRRRPGAQLPGHDAVTYQEHGGDQ